MPHWGISMQTIDIVSSNQNWIQLNRKYKIYAISPASYPYCTLDDLSNIQNINLILNTELFDQNAHPFHSNTDEIRLEMLNQALYSQDPNMLIWCINGGYGCAKLIEKLRHQKQPKTPKPFIGYSDITALLLFLKQEWGWPVIHGACLGEIFKNKDLENFLQIIDLIMRRKSNFYPDDLQPLNVNGKLALKNKHFLKENKWIGGNLSVVQTSINTYWQINADDKILFLEDVNEKGYEIDRMLYHLPNIKSSNKSKMVVFGNFTKSDKDVEYALKDFTERNKHIPIVRTKQIGHGYKNVPIIMQ